MREVSFEKALKYAKKDIVMVSSELKEYTKQHRGDSKELRLIKSIADEIPLPMRRIDKVIKSMFSNLDYVEIMGNATFYVVEY